MKNNAAENLEFYKLFWDHKYHVTHELLWHIYTHLILEVSSLHVFG